MHRCIIIQSVCLCHVEVRALYGRLSCSWLRVATLAMVGSGQGWLGAVVACHAAGCNGRCTSNGGFLSGRHQWPVCVNCGLSYTTVQATITQSAIVVCDYLCSVSLGLLYIFVVISPVF